MKEYGGYLPLELENTGEFYQGKDVLSLNCGRSAIYCALISINPSKVYIPFYNCQSVRVAVEEAGIEFEYYSIDEKFEPLNVILKYGECILWVNYFGIFSNEKVMKMVKYYKNIIIDNTQSFYAKPYASAYNVYSCRKFFGVSDGAYLINEDLKPLNLKRSTSYKKSIQLLKSIDVGTNKGYEEYLFSEKHLFDQVEKMSKLTKKILSSINYEKIKKIRTKNFQVLHQKLEKINELKVVIEEMNQVPMVYPLLIKSKKMRNELIKNRIYVPQWWKYLIKEFDEIRYESYLSKYLLPLPIDQRYCEKDMIVISDLILKVYKNE